MTGRPQKMLIVGGGGHALTVVDVIRSTGQFEASGFVDPDPAAILASAGIDRLGNDEDLADLMPLYPSVHVAVGQIKTAKPRQLLFDRLIALGAQLPRIIASTAYVSPDARMGRGVLISHGAIINIASSIGDNTIINSGAIIEHGAHIGDHCHIAPGAVILGDVNIGDGTFIGAGTVVRETVQIGADQFIGAGQTVTNNVL